MADSRTRTGGKKSETKKSVKKSSTSSKKKTTKHSSNKVAATGKAKTKAKAKATITKKKTATKAKLAKKVTKSAKPVKGKVSKVTKKRPSAATAAQARSVTKAKPSKPSLRKPATKTKTALGNVKATVPYDAGLQSVRAPVVLRSPVEVMGESVNFYRDHDLYKFAEALPPGISLGIEESWAAERAASNGFNFNFVFPPVEVMSSMWNDMMVNLLSDPMGDLMMGSASYKQPWLQPGVDWQHVGAADRPTGSYLLMMRDTTMPRDMLNLTCTRAEKQLRDIGATGLNIFEYMILQRVMAERFGDHRFDGYHGGEHPPGWQWLPGTKIGTKPAMAYYNEKTQGVCIGFCGPDNKNPKKGAYPAVVIPLPL